jgi:hypothetical protein
MGFFRRHSVPLKRLAPVDLRSERTVDELFLYTSNCNLSSPVCQQQREGSHDRLESVPRYTVADSAPGLEE